MVPKPQVQFPEHPSGRHASPSQQESSQSDGSSIEEDYPDDLEFSEDEGLWPDRPAFTGLFRPSVFKSLLHKAKVATNIGVFEDHSDQSQGSAAPHDYLFMVPKQEQEFIPCPKLFSEVIQRPWSQPGSLAAMTRYFIILLPT